MAAGVADHIWTYEEIPALRTSCYARRMVALWLWAGASVATIIASLGWTVVNRQQRWRVVVGLAIALVALISLGFAIYGMTAFCEPPPGSACA